MKIIFLDVDGVLNSRQYFSRADHLGVGTYTYLDPSRIELLHHIVSETGAEIVLSSSWRDAFEGLVPKEADAQHLLDALAVRGLPLLDRTPLIEDRRPEEIMQWLADHDEVECFVILDDHDYNWEELMPYWVRTSYSTGLTAENADKAIQMLNAMKA